MQVHLNSRIVTDPAIHGGQPIVAGTQVTATSLVQGVAAGTSMEEVAAAHGVATEDVRAALEFAAQRAAELVTGNGSSGHITSELTGSNAGTSPIEDEARRLGLDPAHLTPLARRLIELRAQMIASGEPLLSTWEELEAEIAERRGGATQDGE